jgi:hypothetical protein
METNSAVTRAKTSRNDHNSRAPMYMVVILKLSFALVQNRRHVFKRSHDEIHQGGKHP